MIVRYLLIILLATVHFPLLAATYVVNDFSDDPDANPGDGICDIPTGGPPRCSLRAAIMEVNAGVALAFNRIDFAFGPLVIDVTGSPLPDIQRHVVIDGTSVPGYVGGNDVLASPPLITINGSALSGAGNVGLKLVDTDSAAIRGLSIVNFPGDGIQVVQSRNTQLTGNWIGVDRAGSPGRNGRFGVFFDTSFSCVIGQSISAGTTTISGAGNVISNNASDGVFLGSLATDCVVGGNQIGVNPVGFSEMGNDGNGVTVVGADNEIGGYAAGQNGASVTIGNVIQNNAGAGLFLDGGNASVFSNFIGTNDGDGVLVDGFDNTIGERHASSRNQILNNGGHGFHLGPVFGASRTQIENNLILQNGQRGIQVSAGNENEIRGNEIVLNSDAIRIEGNDHLVVDNDLGLLDNSALGNGFNGVVLIGDDNAVLDNRFGGMGDDGVDLVSGNNNRIAGNSIGVRANGINIGNTGIGIRVRAAAQSTRIENNTIGFNSDGIALEGSSTQICGNRIGLGTGFEPAGNRIEGVRIDGDSNLIGAVDFGCSGNFIGNNASDGVQIIGAFNVVANNHIGGTSGSTFGNGNSGVFVGAGSNDTLVQDNQLLNNGNDGIRVSATAGLRNNFQVNDFTDNGDQAIDLGDNGVTANDPGDGDSGPNNLQNTPVITKVVDLGGAIEVEYRVDSESSNSTYPLRVDVYLSAGGQREGFQVYQDQYNQTPNTLRTIIFSPPINGGFITLMATDDFGNSSELGTSSPFTVSPPTGIIFKDSFEL